MQIGSSPFSVATPPIETLAFVPSRIEPPLQYSDCRATRIRLSWQQPSANGALIQAFTLRCLPENSVFVPLLEVSVPVADLERVVTAATALVSGDGSEGGGTRSKRHRETASKKPSRPVVDTTTVLPAVNEEADAVTSTTTPADDVRVSKAKKKRLTTAKKQATDAAKLGAAAPSTDVCFAYVVSGLWPGEIYQFVAAAENRCGLGAFSAVSDYVKMDSTAPDPPAAPLITDVQKRQVDIEWEKPKSNGSEILQYTLEWVQDASVLQLEAKSAAAEDGADASGGVGDSASTPQSKLSREIVRSSVVLLTRSIAGTRYTLQGLEPGKPLRVWLSASNLIDNKICTSELSAASDVAVTLCDVPDTPARPELLHSTPQPSGHTLVLAFTPPKCNGLEIESYDVLLFCEEQQFGITNRRVFRDFNLLPSECSGLSSAANENERCTFAIRKLRGKTFYGVQLCAVNALGAGIMSECSVLVNTQPATVPARILEPPALMSDVEPTQASIGWRMPEHDGGAPVVAFHVQYSMQPTATVLTNDIDEYACDEHSSSGATRYKALFDHEVTVYHDRELLMTFLKPKTTYRFRVASSNAVGRSAFSKKSAPVHTPSLVEFTIAQYFADRPLIEHKKARYIQVRHRSDCECTVSVSVFGAEENLTPKHLRIRANRGAIERGSAASGRGSATSKLYESRCKAGTFYDSPPSFDDFFDLARSAQGYTFCRLNS